ncbi:MAG: phage terminase small subunit P27 family [Planctomycetaceae bacterium]
MPIVPPEWLTAAALEEWQRVVPEMVRLGVISGLDTIVVAQYCEMVADWIAAKAEVHEHGRTVKYESENGSVHVQVSPWYSIAKQLGQEVKRLAAELGLTPASRPTIKGKSGQPGGGLSGWRDKAKSVRGHAKK